MKTMTYANVTVKFNPKVSWARMPLITNRRSPYAFRAQLQARERGLAAMAGYSYQDAPEAISGDL